MGIQESKPKKALQQTQSKQNLKKSKSIARSKSSLSDNAPFKQQILDFSSQLSSMASLSSTTLQSLNYNLLSKMPFKQHFNPLPICSKITRSNDYVFVCFDCSLSDRAYLCQKCFEKGNHQSHRFSVYMNNNGFQHLFCRCGDPQFMKAKTSCKDHAEAPKMPKSVNIDSKQLAKFKAYLGEIYKVLFNLIEKARWNILYTALFNYLKKLTDQNLYYSKMFAEFLIQENCVDFEQSNLKKRIRKQLAFSDDQFQVLRNVCFLQEYKRPILSEIIRALNQNKGTSGMCTFIFNFAGKLDLLNQLAKQDNLIFGQGFSNISDYYKMLIRTKEDASQMWKAVVQNKMMKYFLKDDQTLKTIIKSLVNDQKSIEAILGQFLQNEAAQSEKYVVACLMVLAPQFFHMKKNKPKQLSKSLQDQFAKYYVKIFKKLSIRQRNDPVYPRLLLLLPFFSFGEQCIQKMWEQTERRIDLLDITKDRATIKEASWNFLAFLTTITKQFIEWEHTTMHSASSFGFESYTKDKDLMKKVLIENFDKTPKIMRNNLLSLLDLYTQKNRQIAKEIVKKELRFNTRKDKYYYVGRKLPNNLYFYQELVVGQPLPLGQWHSFVGKKFFGGQVYRFYPTLIKIAQKALKDDLQQVKTVSNLSIFFSLLDKSEKKHIKKITRQFIKALPDVSEHTYYVLAGIRNRFELDIDQLEETGKNGRKRVKLDLITEIRDKKYEEMKQRQKKAKQKWLNAALQSDKQQQDNQKDDSIQVCYICKQKDLKDRRLVYPCFFTQNSVVSIILKSEVTDLDMNICLHHMHEDCFEKVRGKGECPVCKFDFNSYIPSRPLNDESYTKEWLKTFQRIINQFNLNTGKSFSSDWATIFLTYMTYSRSFKVLLKNNDIQNQQRDKIDQLLMLTYKNQMRKWPDLTKQAMKKAQKTVKGQVRRQSACKKVVKSLVLDLILQQITGQAIKNDKRTLKKIRELINTIGSDYAELIKEGCEWTRLNQDAAKIFEQNNTEAGQYKDMFKIRQVPKKAIEFMKTISIKCPMCNKFQPTSWECLFCSKRSCCNCMNTRNHCEWDHRGSAIYLHLNDAQFELMHENRTVKKQSLYKNDYLEGWKRNLDPEGWQANTEEIYRFYEKILHSESVREKRDPADDISDDGRGGNMALFNHENQDQEQEQEQDQEQFDDEDD